MGKEEKSEKEVVIDGLSREKAREIIVKLPRDKRYIVDILSDGRKVYIETSGRKKSRIGGETVSGLDITIHYEGELKRLNYVDDLLLDIFAKKQNVDEKYIEILIYAIKQSIELVPLSSLYSHIPELKALEKMNLSGHSIEFLLIVTRWLAIQEDINYWGINPKTNKQFEGREKPYNAIYDFFIKKDSLFNVIKKHRLVPIFMK